MFFSIVSSFFLFYGDYSVFGDEIYSEILLWIPSRRAQADKIIQVYWKSRTQSSRALYYHVPSRAGGNITVFTMYPLDL